MSQRKFTSDALSKDERTILNLEKKSMEKFEQAHLSLIEANTSLGSHVIIEPDYVKTTYDIDLPCSPSLFSTVNMIFSGTIFIFISLVVPIMALSGIMTLRELITSISILGITIPGALRFSVINYNGGGINTRNQPVRRLLSKILLSKAEKELMKGRVQEREFYYLALEIRKAVANKLINDMKNKGYEEVLREAKKRENFRENSFHQLEFNETKGIIVLNEYNNGKKNQIESNSASSSETNMKSLLSFVEDIKKDIS